MDLLRAGSIQLLVLVIVIGVITPTMRSAPLSSAPRASAARAPLGELMGDFVANHGQ